MQRAGNKIEFRLEVLEPRILLSADPMVLAASSPGEWLPASASEVMVKMPEAELTYDPSAEINQIFEGVARAPLPSEKREEDAADPSDDKADEESSPGAQAKPVLPSAALVE